MKDRPVVVVLLIAMFAMFVFGISFLLYNCDLAFENYEGLTKKGNPVWKVTYGHNLHDGTFDYEDTNQDGLVDRVEKGYLSEYFVYVLVKDAEEQRIRGIEMLNKAREYVKAHPGSIFTEALALPVRAEEEKNELLLFFKTVHEDSLKYVTFVVRGTLPADRLQSRFERAKKRPEDPELTSR